MQFAHLVVASSRARVESHECVGTMTTCTIIADIIVATCRCVAFGVVWPRKASSSNRWNTDARARVVLLCGCVLSCFFDADIDFVLVHNSARALICAHICTWQMQRRRFATVVQPQREGVPSTIIQARIILYYVCVDS